MGVKTGAGLLAAVVFALASREAAAQPTVVKAPQCGTTFKHDLYTVCFDGSAWAVDEPTNSRFTNRDRVEVAVRHFNFLRYTLSFDVKEEKSESYQYLTKLWSSILSPDVLTLFALGAEERAADPAVTVMRDLFRRSQALDQKITTITSLYKRTGLSVAEATDLKNAVFGPSPNRPPCDPANFDDLDKPAFPPPTPANPSKDDPLMACTVQEIVRGLNLSYARLSQMVLMSDALFLETTASTSNKKTLYALVVKTYADVRKRADTFVALAQKTVGVETKKAGAHQAGTRVTLTLSAVDEGGARSPITDVNYFVETTMPLVVHGGVAFSTLRDVDFDKVKRATAFGEEELFQKTSDSDSTKGFSAFLSWVLTPLAAEGGPNSSRAALLISLGTDVTKPGQTIFAGPSLLLFNRMALTAGVALGKEADGETPTLDPNIFRVIKERPKAKFFFSLTSKVH